MAFDPSDSEMHSLRRDRQARYKYSVSWCLAISVQLLLALCLQPPEIEPRIGDGATDSPNATEANRSRLFKQS